MLWLPLLLYLPLNTYILLQLQVTCAICCGMPIDAVDVQLLILELQVRAKISTDRVWTGVLQGSCS